jgi:hypothetical protein
VNLIEKWINTDKKLYNLITEIESLDISLVEKAAIAFEKLAKLYNIPRMPEDILDDEDENKRSLFEEHAFNSFEKLAHDNFNCCTQCRNSSSDCVDICSDCVNLRHCRTFETISSLICCGGNLH